VTTPATPIAWVPYGGYWSTPFVRWQGAFAELHSLRFAAWTAKRALAKRQIDAAVFDHGVFGFTVPQRGSFYGLPWLMGEIGAPHVAGPSVMQACATSARCVALAARDVAAGSAQTALVVAADRVSNGPHLYYPQPSAPGGTGEAENWLLDNFARDPFAGVAMVETAENCAAKWSITREEQDDLTLLRATQYEEALADDDRAFHRRFMELPFEVPDPRFTRVTAKLPGDVGVQPSDPAKLRALNPVRAGGTVTYGGQTHPADGNAGMIVTTRDGAKEIAQGGPEIALLGFGQARVEPAYMPAAPVPATQRALDQAGLSIGDIHAVTSHNPFAVNDIVFVRETGFPLDRMNAYGCSLIWGHPQGPTGLRALIELIETLAIRGGGRGLFQGCAAGDSAMAVVIEVRA
jgi:acetyl-CoA acetyltransferase